MPYESLRDLPESVKKLSKELQEAWMKAFNAAYEQYEDEQKAFATAWSVVRKMQEDIEEAEWTTKEALEDQDIFEALTIDEEKKKAHVVVIKEGWSKNKRYYPADVLNEAVPLFEGAKCYLDHADFKGTPTRSVRELTGFYENVKFAGKQVEADLQFLNTEAGRVGLEIAKETIKHNKALAGLSIRGMAVLRKVEEGHEVKSLKNINSVDIVSDPAAGGEFIRLYESIMEENQMKDLTLEKLREERPDIVQAITDEVESRVYGKKGELDKQLKEIKEQNEKLAKDIADWKTYGQIKETETVLEKELAKSELPDIAKERIRKMYEGKIAKAEDILESIKLEKEYIAKIAEKKQVNVGNSGKDNENENKELYEDKQRKIFKEMGYSEQQIEELMKIKR